MKRIFLYTLISASVFTSAFGAVVDATPGSLVDNDVLTSADSETLEVKGRIDVRDLRALASASVIKNLDLSGAKIVAYTAPSPDAHGQSYYSEGLIPQYTFFNSTLSTVVLPEGVSEIGAGAFSNSDVETINFPAGLRVIGEHAFYGCAKLGAVTLPNTVTSIGAYSFANASSLKSADLRNTAIVLLPSNAFSGDSSLTAISVPVCLRTIGSHAFEGTALTSLPLSQVTRFEDYSLAGMPSLTEVTFGQNASIGTGVLMDDHKLQTINNAPASLPVLFAANCNSFDASKIVSRTVAINDYSLANTTAENLVLSPRLTYVGAAALKGMKDLKLIDARSLGEDIPDADPKAFEGIHPEGIALYVEDNTEDLWKEHPVWKDFAIYSDQTDVKVVPVVIPKSKVMYADGLLTVEASDDIKSVDVYALDGALLLHSEPNATRYEGTVSTSANVLIVRVATPAGVDSTKILVY